MRCITKEDIAGAFNVMDVFFWSEERGVTNQCSFRWSCVKQAPNPETDACESKMEVVISNLS